MKDFTFIPTSGDPDGIQSGYFVCHRCGEKVAQGMLNFVDHTEKCNPDALLYKVATDNEMRNLFLEYGMPKMGFEAFGYTPPLDIEREIFQNTVDQPEPEYVVYTGYLGHFGMQLSMLQFTGSIPKFWMQESKRSKIIVVSLYDKHGPVKVVIRDWKIELRVGSHKISTIERIEQLPKELKTARFRKKYPSL